MNKAKHIPQRTQTILWFGLLGWVLIFIMAIMTTTISMENKLLTEVRNTLTHEGYDRVTANISGRDVILSGLVGSEFAEQNTRQVISQLTGVRSVITKFQIVPIRHAHLSLTRTASHQVFVTGELPNIGMKEQLSTLLKTQASLQSYTEPQLEITINSDVSMPNWFSALIGSLESAQNGIHTKIEIGASHITFHTTVKNQMQYEKLILRLRTIAKNYGLRLTNQVAILPIAPSK